MRSSTASPSHEEPPPPLATSRTSSSTRGNLAEARSLAEEALELRQNLAHPGGIAHALHALAAVAYDELDFGTSLKLYGGGRARATTPLALGVTCWARCWPSLTAHVQLGRSNEAAAILRSAVARASRAWATSRSTYTRCGSLQCCATTRDDESGVLLFGAADSKMEKSGMTYFGAREGAGLCRVRPARSPPARREHVRARIRAWCSVVGRRPVRTRCRLHALVPAA